jgi:hypothetical protein
MALLPKLCKGECFLRPPIISGRDLSPSRAGSWPLHFFFSINFLSYQSNYRKKQKFTRAQAGQQGRGYCL